MWLNCEKYQQKGDEDVNLHMKRGMWTRACGRHLMFVKKMCYCNVWKCVVINLCSSYVIFRWVCLCLVFLYVSLLIIDLWLSCPAEWSKRVCLLHKPCTVPSEAQTVAACATRLPTSSRGRLKPRQSSLLCRPSSAWIENVRRGNHEPDAG